MTSEAVRRGAALHVVYAVPDRDEAGPVLVLVTKVAEDGAVRALVRESERAALTVVGTRGLGGFTAGCSAP